LAKSRVTQTNGISGTQNVVFVLAVH